MQLFISKAFYRLKIGIKQQLRQSLSTKAICHLKSILFWLQFGLHFVYLLVELFFYRYSNKRCPILLSIANPGSIGGTELQLRIIGKQLKNRWGDALILISGKIEEGASNLFLNSLKTLQISYLKVGNIGLAPYSQMPKLRKWVRTLLHPVWQNAQICHFFNPASTFLAPLAKEAGLQIYYMETGMPERSLWWQSFEGTLKEFDFVTSVSKAGLQKLQALYGYRGPCCVIPSMVDIGSTPPKAKKPIEGTFHIVYFGRMSALKKLDLLLNAFSRLLKTVPYAQLSLIGSGETQPLLKKQAVQLQMGEQVRFIDWLTTGELFSELTQADLFCLPSETEGLPSSILEAMSIGLAILATDVGGVREIIEPNVSGILIPPNDEEALFKALGELAQNPSLRSSLGKTAFDAFHQRESQKATFTHLMAAYGNL